MSEPSATPAVKPKNALRKDLFSWLQALSFALLGLILCFTFLGRIISVDGNSMLPTLHNRDMLLLQCFGYTAKAGDIVVLNKPFGSIDEPIVKRIIATGGQTVEINYEEALVYVDGKPLSEPYIKEIMLPLGADSIESVLVPEGSVFVMGDNRNASSDSRVPALGTVDERYILGRALWVLLPFQSFGPVQH